MEHAIACVVLAWILMIGAVQLERGLWKQKRGMVQEPQKQEQKYEIVKSTDIPPHYDKPIVSITKWNVYYDYPKKEKKK